ncbi:MAG TPA: M1 family aminopeptidase [Elusimicrobiota bacterium]|nr:M1 family aminopeptidase [Elusimicrobiota bacterium]
MMTMEERHACSGMMDSRFALAGSEPQYAPDRTFDTEHIRLEVELDFKQKALRGRCVTTLRAIVAGASTMVFDAVGFKLDFVRSAGRALRHEYDGRRLTAFLPAPVRAGTTIQIEIGYRLRRPPLGLYFVGPDKKYPHKPVQAWTQGEDEYARYWFPCHDAPHERTTTEVVARVPRGFTAVSNGRLVRRTHGSRTSVFHFRQDIPHATYLVSLAVGRFTELRDSWRGRPVLYYCPPGREEDAKRAFGKTPKMMEFFSKKIGVPYPYPKYSQVAAVDFIYGGMENTSATTQTALTLHDDRAHLDFSSDSLVAHELAHQWFGDLLTCKSWPHAWLNESFATYFEALFQEYDKGKDEFCNELHQNAEAYFDEDKDHYRRPIVTKVYKRPSDLFDRHLYEKGSLVLHMLRHLLGEDGFWKSIHAYVVEHRGKAVETRDFIDAIEKATGRNVEKFFDQWIYKAGHPEYKVRFWWVQRTKQVHLRVVQMQRAGEETGLFSLPVTFSFWTSSGERRFTEVVERKSHLFKFKLPSAPQLVLFDPDHVILKRVDFPKPEAMWITQLRRDPHPLGRLAAAKVLGRLATPESVKALAEALLKETFWLVQGEIAWSLGSIRTPSAVAALWRGFEAVRHPKARRVLIAALGEVRTGEVLERLRAAYKKEKSYFAEAQALKSLARCGHPSVKEIIREQMKEESWNEVLRCGALEAMTQLSAPEVEAFLRKYTVYGHPNVLRQTAVRCLAQLPAPGAGLQKALLALTRDPYLLVRLAAVRALRVVGDERAVPALKKLTRGDLDGRLMRAAEEAVQQLQKGIEPSEKKADH